MGKEKVKLNEIRLRGRVNEEREKKLDGVGSSVSLVLIVLEGWVELRLIAESKLIHPMLKRKGKSSRGSYERWKDVSRSH